MWEESMWTPDQELKGFPDYQTGRPRSLQASDISLICEIMSVFLILRIRQ